MRFEKHYAPVSSARRAFAVSLAGLLLGAGLIVFRLCPRHAPLLSVAGRATISARIFPDPRPTPLLSVARRLTWNVGEGDSGLDCVWQSDTDLITFRPRKPANSTEYQPKYAARWNLLTGVETKLPALSRVINAGHGDGPFLQAISPDGRRLLWTTPVSATRHFLSAFVDGHGLMDICETMYRAHAPTYEERVLWADDGHTLLQVGEADKLNKLPPGQYAWLLDLDKPQLVRRLSFAKGSEFDSTSLFDTGHVAVSGKILQVVPVSPPTAQGSAYREARIEERRVDSKVMRVRQFTVSLPCPSESFQAHFSPRGDRIAWLLDTRQQSAFDALQSRRLSRPPAPVQRHQLWTSRADGSHIQHIGDLPAVPVDADGSPLVLDYSDSKQQAEHLQWLPGGTKISFLYNGSLYLVDAPPED